MRPFLGNALRTDEQPVRHFEAFELPPWREGEYLNGLISTLTLPPLISTLTLPPRHE